MQPLVRLVTPQDDMQALTDLVHRAYAHHAAAGLRYWGTHQSVEDTARRFREGLGLVMLAEGAYLGTVTVRPPAPDSPVELYRRADVYTLSQFCIAPEHQGQGLGKLLHDRALTLARDHGARVIALDTAQPASGLIALYERWGYRVVGEGDWRPWTNYVSVVLARPLDDVPRSGDRLLPGPDASTE